MRSAANRRAPFRSSDGHTNTPETRNINAMKKPSLAMANTSMPGQVASSTTGNADHARVAGPSASGGRGAYGW
jgi:hypothetical protein